MSSYVWQLISLMRFLFNHLILFTHFYSTIEVIFVEFLVNLYFAMLKFVNTLYILDSTKIHSREKRDAYIIYIITITSLYILTVITIISYILFLLIDPASVNNSTKRNTFVWDFCSPSYCVPQLHCFLTYKHKLYQSSFLKWKPILG